MVYHYFNLVYVFDDRLNILHRHATLLVLIAVESLS